MNKVDWSNKEEVNKYYREQGRKPERLKYQREWRRRWRENNREQLNSWFREYYKKEENNKVRRARNKLNYAIRKGRVEKENCEVCGSEKVEGHHENYDKPLEVRWLCREHHRVIHRK